MDDKTTEGSKIYVEDNGIITTPHYLENTEGLKGYVTDSEVVTTPNHLESHVNKFSISDYCILMAFFI